MTEEWSEPWYRLTDDRQRALFEEELRKELSDKHPLAERSFKILARRGDRDDVLLTLDGGESGRVAEVHLTWSGKVEADPRWPTTVIFESIEAWRQQSKQE
jgi:hypothetical protein